MAFLFLIAICSLQSTMVHLWFLLNFQAYSDIHSRLHILRNLICNLSAYRGSYSWRKMEDLVRTCLVIYRELYEWLLWLVLNRFFHLTFGPYSDASSNCSSIPKGRFVSLMIFAAVEVDYFDWKERHWKHDEDGFRLALNNDSNELAICRKKKGNGLGNRPE